MSWSVSSSKPPLPSVSMINTEHGSPFCVKLFKGVPHIQIPLVQGLTDEPTLKPPFLLSSSRLRRQLLPVRHIPATETTPIGPLTCIIILTTSSFTSNLPSFTVSKGMASYLKEYSKSCLMSLIFTREAIFIGYNSSVFN